MHKFTSKRTKDCTNQTIQASSTCQANHYVTEVSILNFLFDIIELYFLNKIIGLNDFGNNLTKQYSTVKVFDKHGLNYLYQRFFKV